MLRPYLLAAAALGLAAGCSRTGPPAPDPSGPTDAPEAPPAPEAWVCARSLDGEWLVRVDGGPSEQVVSKRPRPTRPTWITPPPPGFGLWGLLIDDGKRVVFAARKDLIEPKVPPDTAGGLRYDLVVADRDGQNLKRLLPEVSGVSGFEPHPDGRSVICPAEQGGTWGVYRVPLDGTPPVKLSRRACISSPVCRVLADGRVAYLAGAEWVVERSEGGTTYRSAKGPVVVIDGASEVVLIQEPMRYLPYLDLTPDPTKAAVALRADGGDQLIGVHDRVRVLDLKTGAAEDFPLAAFSKDWKGLDLHPRIRADGKAVAVRFAVNPYPVPPLKEPVTAEAAGYLGVIWLDGRKDRTAAHRVDLPRNERGHRYPIGDVEWAAAPAAKE